MGDPPLLNRAEATELFGRLTTRLLADPGDADVRSALVNICHRLALRRGAGPGMRTWLRVLAAEAPLRVRQHAQFALSEAGDTEWLVPVLVAEITGHPVRTGADGPHNGSFGWRADATACVWLGKIGPQAAAAVPVLWSLLAETGEPGAARPAAAEAYWRITGDADTALSVLDSLMTGDVGELAREVAARIRACGGTPCPLPHPQER